MRVGSATRVDPLPRRGIGRGSGGRAPTDDLVPGGGLRRARRRSQVHVGVALRGSGGGTSGRAVHERGSHRSAERRDHPDSAGRPGGGLSHADIRNAGTRPSSAGGSGPLTTALRRWPGHLCVLLALGWLALAVERLGGGGRGDASPSWLRCWSSRYAVRLESPAGSRGGTPVAMADQASLGGRSAAGAAWRRGELPRVRRTRVAWPYLQLAGAAELWARRPRTSRRRRRQSASASVLPGCGSSRTGSAMCC